MFLSVVSIFSIVQTIFHLPSLWYRYKVSMQMESASSELGQENIDPSHVVNQYNLPISESRNEAIWQMMVQWGQYYCLAWYVTWRLQISEVDKATDEFDDVNDLLNFSKLCPSLISSACSLTYGQFVAHNITYKYRTSGKQKLLYMWSCAMSTICNIFILLVWQTAIKDLSIGYHVNHQSSFHFDDPSVLIISLMLLTPFLYKFMVLPTSTKEYKSASMKTPRFLHGVMMQCFVFSFFLGLSAIVNSRLYIWGPAPYSSLSYIAYQITNNTDFESKFLISWSFSVKNSLLEMNPFEYTPANAYEGDPFNNRLFLIIFSCLGIPLSFVSAYLGLYFYFEDGACCVAFTTTKKVQSGIFIFLFITFPGENHCEEHDQGDKKFCEWWTITGW